MCMYMKKQIFWLCNRSAIDFGVVQTLVQMLALALFNHIPMQRFLNQWSICYWPIKWEYQYLQCQVCERIKTIELIYINKELNMISCTWYMLVNIIFLISIIIHKLVLNVMLQKFANKLLHVWYIYAYMEKENARARICFGR